MSGSPSCSGNKLLKRIDIIRICDTSRIGDTIYKCYYLDTVKHERVGLFKVQTTQETKTRFIRYYNLVVTDSIGLKKKDGHCIYLTTEEHSNYNICYIAVEADSFSIKQYNSKISEGRLINTINKDSIGYYFLPKTKLRYIVRVWIRGISFDEELYWRMDRNGNYIPLLKPFKSYIRGIGYLN
ncbi:MAG: hypothetical protein ACK5XN_24990 [Bacteroidota bacterium]